MISHQLMKRFAYVVLPLVFSVVGPTALAQQVLRVTTIPEEAATEQVRKFGPLTKYLERTVGMKVEFVPVNDYPAAVEALVNKQVELVWFGGFTHVQAQIRSGGKLLRLLSVRRTLSFDQSSLPRKAQESQSSLT